jgi:aminoglycoside phosphotransferase (APT) family kinase protein
MTGLLTEPKIEEWMPPEEQQFRGRAKEYLERAGDMGLLPAPLATFGIFPKGVSSVVFLVNAETEPFVAKMALEPTKVAVEAACFKAWHDHGVKTPQVYSSHVATSDLPVSMATFEYIEAADLSEEPITDKAAANQVSRKLGRFLAQMHEAKSSGFGIPQLPDLTGKRSTFGEEVLPSLHRRLESLAQRSIITSKDTEEVLKAFWVLEADVGRGRESCLTHNDYLTYNVLNTEPFTVFDPDPLVTHPMLDLATSMIISEAIGQPDRYGVADEILAGYREMTQVDSRMLSAAAVVRTIRKMNTWAHKNRMEQVNICVEILRREAKKLDNY